MVPARAHKALTLRNPMPSPLSIIDGSQIGNPGAVPRQ